LLILRLLILASCTFCGRHLDSVANNYFKKSVGHHVASDAYLRFGHGLVNSVLLYMVTLGLHLNVQITVAKRLAFSSHSDISCLLICTYRGLFLHLIGRTALDEGRARRKDTGFVPRAKPYATCTVISRGFLFCSSLHELKEIIF
jgi:hypothetical protein